MPMLTSARQERFAQLVVQGLPQEKAYEKAGYKRAPAAASRLAKNIKVKARIDELSQRAAADTQITKEWLIERLVDTARRAADDATRAAEVAAYKELAVLTGHRVEKQEQEQNVRMTVSEEPLSEDEWEAQFAAEPARGNA